MKKGICIFLAVIFLFTCSVVAFADVELFPSSAVSWSDVGEDALNLANAYINTLKSESGKEFFKNVSDLPISWLKTLANGSWALSPVDDYYYFLKDGLLYVGKTSGDGVGGAAVSLVSGAQDFYIPSDTVIDQIENENSVNTPKGKDLFIQSYWSEMYLHALGYNQAIPIFDDTDKTQFNDLYIIPFYKNADGVYYYGEYEYHLYYVPIDDPNADVTLQCDSYLHFSDVGAVLQPDASGRCFDMTNLQIPLCLGISPSFQNIFYFDSDDYLNGTATSFTTFEGTSGVVPDVKLFSANSSSPLTWKQSLYDKFQQSYKKTTATRDEDFGFICSHSLIERTYKDIDTSKIPSNHVVNISGDTIYDYSITNPDTGESTTINEYVTNNYIYPEAPSTSEPSGGGSGVGGNVNVGGNINVGGQVGVDITVSVPDININVNDNGGGAGGSGGTVVNPDDILDGSSVDLDKYYDDAVSQASGVRAFLGQFFDFLPAELVGLLGLLIAVAIVCRLFGR